MIFLRGAYVTYNNFECLSYNYLLCFNVYVTALLVFPFFWFGMFEIIPFQYILQSRISHRNIWVVYDLLIAIFRLEVCDVIIMLQFVIVSSHTFSIVMSPGFF